MWDDDGGDLPTMGVSFELRTKGVAAAPTPLIAKSFDRTESMIKGRSAKPGMGRNAKQDQG